MPCGSMDALIFGGAGGSLGSTGNSSSQAGGAGGKYITGASYATWTTTGTRLGSAT